MSTWQPCRSGRRAAERRPGDHSRVGPLVRLVSPKTTSQVSVTKDQCHQRPLVRLVSPKTTKEEVLIQTIMAAGIKEASVNIDAAISSMLSDLENILSLKEHLNRSEGSCWWKPCYGDRLRCCVRCCGLLWRQPVSVKSCVAMETGYLCEDVVGCYGDGLPV